VLRHFVAADGEVVVGIVEIAGEDVDVAVGVVVLVAAAEAGQRSSEDGGGEESREDGGG